MTKWADLHIHTHFSDSTDSPEQVVEKAIANGLHCVGITDHDTVEGIVPTMEAAKGKDLEVIPGIEFSTEIHGQDLHVLGYFIDCRNPQVLKSIAIFQNARIARIAKMIDKLKEFGINNITVDEVCALTASDSVGRPHLAAMLERKGWVSSQREAFNKYLGDDSPCYVHKYKQTPYEAIDLIRQIGGVAVYAHPLVTNKDELIPGFVESGLAGIEVYYPNCSEHVIQYYEKLARKYNLVAVGGSDAHGQAKSYTYIGKIKIPCENVEALRARIKK